MTTLWPDADCDYDYPQRNAVNDNQWQAAITRSRRDGHLRLEPRGGDDGRFELAGACPRCGHAMSQPIEFEVILAVAPDQPRFGHFNIVCNCREKHTGRDDKHRGCGWGGAIPVGLATD